VKIYSFCNRWVLRVAVVLALELSGFAIAAPPKINTPKVTGTEEGWIIGDVSRDLGQLLGFAQAQENGGNTSGPPPTITLQPQASGAAGAYTVQAQPEKGTAFAQDFTVSGSPWEPEAYLPWAKSLAEAWGVKPQAALADAMPDEKLIALLNEPTIENFLSANATLSAALTKTPGNAGLHEQAALLLATLAWSESATFFGTFTDPRELMNSACAHLAMAELLRGSAPEGTAGRLAELTLLVITGRQAEAEQQLGALAATANLPPSTQDWVETLRLENCGDWRKFTPGPDASLLFCWEYYGTLALEVGDYPASRFASQMMTQARPNWGRTIFYWDFCGCSCEDDLKDHKVEIAKIMHALGRGPAPAPDEETKQAPLMSMLGLDMVHDLDETQDPGTEANTTTAPDTTGAQNTTVVQGSATDNTTLFLNELHTGPWQGGGLAVVSPGEWGGREQRRLLSLLARVNTYITDDLYAPKQAAQFRKQQADPWINSLRLGPFLKPYFANNQAQYNAAMNTVGLIISAHPEWAGAGFWQQAHGPWGAWKYRPVVPDYKDWFQPWMPRGTAYDSYYRMNFTELSDAKPEVFQPWLKLAPFDANVQMAALNAATGGHPTAEAVKAALEPAVDYSVPLGRLVADASLGNMTAYQQAMQPVCDLNSSFYLMMGRTLLQHGLEDQAAAAYQKAADHFEEYPIQMSNEMLFLVNYYFDHGKKDEAMKIAQMAAAVNSEAGLETRVRLELRLGNITGAWKLAQASDQNYGAASARLMVYNVWEDQPGDAKAKRPAARLWMSYFPKSTQMVKLADFAQAAAPTDGAQLTADSSYTTLAGLEIGDVIVAINGRRVRSTGDAQWMLDFGIVSDYQMIIWQNGQYLEKTVHLPERQNGPPLGIALKNFKSKGGA